MHASCFTKDILIIQHVYSLISVYSSVTINVTGNSAHIVKLWDKHGLVRDGKMENALDTGTDWAHIAQESLIEGLITVQYELRMKRFTLT